MPHRIPFWPVVEAGTPAPLPSEGGGRATVNAKPGLMAKRRFAVAPATPSAAMPLAAAPIASGPRPGYACAVEVARLAETGGETRQAPSPLGRGGASGALREIRRLTTPVAT